MTRLVLIRGVPGSGKSTMARVLAMVGFRHYEADMYFERDGVYAFDPEKSKDAHAWCQQQTAESLNAGEWVVVSNTFTRQWEMQPYRDMAKACDAAVTVIEATGKWTSIHGVPAETMARMRERWESA